MSEEKEPSAAETEGFGVEQFRLTPEQEKKLTSRPVLKMPWERKPKTRKPVLYLGAQIPVVWLEKAFALPGRALHVGIRIWLLIGLRRSRTVHLSTTPLELDRKAAYRGLKALEQAGLVSVVRQRGRLPKVTVQKLEEESQ